jgi:bacterioferritin-associated ferredoxin
MYICVCRGVTDSQIKQSLADGATRYDLFAQFGIGSQCGKCNKCVKELMNIHTIAPTLVTDINTVSYEEDYR